MTRWLSLDRARLWQVGGLATVAVILVSSWLLLLHPQRLDVVASQSAADSARTAQAAELTKLRALRADFVKFDDYRDQLAADRQALPGTDAMPAFLRELQAAGEASGVAVTQVGVGTPTAVDAKGAAVTEGDTAADTTMYAIAVTLLATGDAATDEAFLHQLQQLQPRAVLFDTLTLAAEGDVGTGDAGSTYTLTATLRVFVDTASAAPVPR